MTTSYSIPDHVMGYVRGLGYEDTYTPMAPHIAEWDATYRARGDFWDKVEVDGRVTYKVHRRSVRPAQRVCREWASLMLNEDTLVRCEDEACNEWLAGYLDRVRFWSRGQELVERAFALGTGAWALWLDTAAGSIQVRRYHATSILILSWDDDGVTEVALCTRATVGGREYDQLQMHLLRADGYHIVTRLWDADGAPVALDGVVEDYPTGSRDPWFAVVTPSLGNTVVDLSPYGMSVFGHARDVMEAVDIAFDALVTEPQAGKMRVFMSDVMFQVTGEGDGRRVIPFGREDATYYRAVSDVDGNIIREFAPALRTDALVRTYRAALQTMGDACGFGLSYFDVDDSGGIKTATEVSSDNSQLMRNIRKHENLLGDAIAQIARAVLQAARRLGVANLPPEGDVSVAFDDSIVTDTQSEKRQDLAEVGVTLNAWEYRMRWYGEDEETAKRNAPRQDLWAEHPAVE